MTLVPMKLMPVKLIPVKILKRLIATAGFAACMANAVNAEVIDVLVLYTPEALQTRNGADIDARISSYITYSNDAYSNAQVDMEVRLVGSALLDANYDYVTETNLDNLRRNSTVANLRREHGADAVVLLNLRQQVSNGYICGIGYVPSGDSNSGRLYSNASSVAYSLVGIDCGVNTFTHEVGHNMSLGHSYTQGSAGGVWRWARGHGVQGLFSTIMAYPHAYGTYRQLPVFSNPRINSCEGQACGVDQALNNGADAAANLTALAQQIAGFMPTVHDIDDGDDGGGDDNGDDDTPPSDTPCEKDPVTGNLLINGEFDSTDSWQSGFGQSTLSITALPAEGCLDNALVVGNRTQYYSSAFQSIDGKLTAGNSYQFNGKFGIANGSRETIRVALRIRSYWGSRYAYLDPVSVTANELTSFQQNFTLSSGNVDGLLIYGPAAGVDMVMDSLSIVPLNSAASASAAVDRLDELAAAEPVLNEQFELKANGWRSFHGGRLSYTADASAGKYSLRASKRKSEYAGPTLDATGALQAGNSYQLNASVKVMGATSQQTVQAWLFYVDNSGSHWQKLAISSAPVGAWQTLEGQFVIDADGDIVRARLHILGPEANHSLQLDNLIIERL